MAEEKIRTKRYDSRIPLLVVIPFLVLGAIWVLGFDAHSNEQKIQGSFTLGAGIESLIIRLEVGNLEVLIGSAGRVSFVGETLRVAGSAEHLSRAISEPFTLFQDENVDPTTLVLGVTSLPEGFVRLPIEEDGSRDGPRLFRQLNAIISVPVDLAVVIEAEQGSISVNTRQAKTTITTGSGTVIVREVSAPLIVQNGDGPTIVDQHRGTIDLKVNGKTRVVMAELSGQVDIDNSSGEVILNLPRYASFELDARSLVSSVRSAFALPREPLGAVGFCMVGRVGTGGPRVRVETKDGSITIGAVQ